MNNTFIRLGSIAAVGSLTALIFIGGAAPANADTYSAGGSDNQCLVRPATTSVVTHDEQSHINTVTIPGKEAVVSIEQRWSREVPATEEVSHQEVKYQREIPGTKKVWHLQWLYKWFVPGEKEKPHHKYKFSRENHGQQEKSHQEWQFTRPVSEQSHQEYKYQQQEQQYRFQSRAEESDQAEWGPWSDWGTSNPGADTATQTAETRTATTDYNGGDWTGESLGAPWVKVDERTVIDTEASVEYRTADGAGSTNPADAAWFTESSFDGWSAQGSTVAVEQSYVAPSTEYRTADGASSTNPADAAWFDESSFEGWSAEGGKPADGQHNSAGQTFYLTKDAQGNLGKTTVKSEASFFTKDDAPVDPKWVKTDIEKVVTQEATPDRIVYLTLSDTGVFGETEDLDQATWISTENTSVDLSIWQPVVNKHGEPLTRTVIDKEAVPGYTEYYVPNGTPTRELGDSNWTTDEPEGWTLVDDREVVEHEAVPPSVVSTKVVDKAASSETISTPAQYEPCVLASTGVDNPFGPGGVGLLAIGSTLAGVLLVGLTGVTRLRKRLSGA